MLLVILLTTYKLSSLTLRFKVSFFFPFPLHITCPRSFSLSVRLNQCCSGLAFAESTAAPLGKSRSHWSISPAHYFLLDGHNQNWMATSQRQTLLLLSLHRVHWCFSFWEKIKQFWMLSPILALLALFLFACVRIREWAFSSVFFWSGVISFLRLFFLTQKRSSVCVCCIHSKITLFISERISLAFRNAWLQKQKILEQEVTLLPAEQIFGLGMVSILFIYFFSNE